MQKAAVEEMVGRGIRVCRVEAPPRLSLGIRPDDGSRQEGLKMLDVSDEVGPVGEGAEEACIG